VGVNFLLRIRIRTCCRYVILLTAYGPFSQVCTAAREYRCSTEEWNCLASCHRFKANAHGLPVVMVPLVLYSDDTSGNRSKKWNKFDVWAMMLAGLPQAENSQLENIHFICCSNETSSIEMAEPIVKDLSRLETHGIIAYDAHLKRDVLVVAPVLCTLCDNPRAAELLNHQGSTTRKFCRMCLVSIYAYTMFHHGKI